MQSLLLTHHELRVHAGNDGGERRGTGGALPKRLLSAANRRTLRGRLQILGVVPVRNKGGAARCNGDEGRNAAHRTAHVADGAVIHTIHPGMSLRAFPPHYLSRCVKDVLRREGSILLLVPFARQFRIIVVEVIGHRNTTTSTERTL